MTMRDVAELAGVSVATVSRVVNERPDVADATRSEVLQVMRRYGFTANRSARGLAAGRTGLIAVTVPALGESYITAILTGIADALAVQDQRVVICPTNHPHDREASLLRHLMDGTTDGAILVLPEGPSAELERLREQGYPIVVADPRTTLEDGIPTVSTAHAEGARAAVEHLLGLGHRRIALLTGIPGWMATEERLLGYRATLAAAGLEPDAAIIAGGDYSLECGYEVAATWFDSDRPPTAILASNDELAVGAMRAVFEHGLRIPDDVSIVGFDDTALARSVLPSLTTVRQPLEEIGRTAVSLLGRLLVGQPTEALRVELSPRLVVRESTGPLVPFPDATAVHPVDDSRTRRERTVA